MDKKQAEALDEVSYIPKPVITLLIGLYSML